MRLEGLVQARTDLNAQDGEWGMVRLGQALELLTSEAHPRYLDAARRGQLFTSTPGPITMSVASAVVQGLVLTNPPDSPVLIAVQSLTISQGGSPTGNVTLGMYAAPGPVTHTTPATVQPVWVGAVGKAWGLVDRAGTVSATNLAVIRALGGAPVATGSVQGNFIYDEIAGAIVLTPNCAIAVQQVGGSGAYAPRLTITWEEIPL